VVAHGRQPRNGRLTGAGTAAQRDIDGRAAGGMATDDVGGFGPRWSGWRLGRDDDARGEAAAARARLRRALSGRGCRDAWCAVSTAALRRVRAARRVSAMWQRHAAVRARRGARRLTGGAHSSAISEFKNHPDENSSK
jgi:hypothetical protein